MLGIILVSIGSFLAEISSSIGKVEVQNKKQTIYSMAFLSLFWSALWFLAIIIYKNKFLFSFASLPTLVIRNITEIVLIYVTTLATVKSDRSTFGFVRTGTIPLLLLVDLFLGYALTIKQIIGIMIIAVALLFSFINHGFKKNGLKLVAVSAVLSVITLSLYKYNITHFNSVEAEQFISVMILLVFTFIAAVKIGRENPLKMLTKRVFFAQSSASGIAVILMSFAYLFAPASVITAAKRAISVFWAIISGNLYFQEKQLVFKIIMFVLVALGIILLAW